MLLLLYEELKKHKLLIVIISATILALIFLAISLIISIIISGGIGNNSCSSGGGSETYSADFKITNWGPAASKHGNASKDIEKWGASQHLNAAQVAGVLGNAMAESGVGTNGAGGGKYGDVLGAGSGAADTSHNGDSLSAYMNWFVNTFSNTGTSSKGHNNGAWNKYRSMTSSSPYDLGYFWGAHLDAAAAGNYAQRGHWAEDAYKAISGGSSNVTSNVGSTASSSSSCGSSSGGTDTADGTGSIKEKPNDGNTAWKPGNLPDDVKPFIHSPSSVGMAYGNGKGWCNKDSDGECVPFATSYFAALWGLKDKFPMVPLGKDEVEYWNNKVPGGTVSTTPKAGDVAASTCGWLGGNHTFVIEHVLSDGDFLIAEQNWPGMSGSWIHKPYTWNYAVLPKNTPDTRYYRPSSKYHLKWSS